MEVGLFVWQDESRKETDEKDSGSLTVDEIEHYLRLKHGMALPQISPGRSPGSAATGKRRRKTPGFDSAVRHWSPKLRLS
jgi:hypothetical protein